MAIESKPLNVLTKLDKFRILARCSVNDVTYAFQVVGPMHGRGPTFNCHMYETPFNMRYPAYVKTGTVGFDTSGHSNTRAHGEGRTLEDLVHNVDWPHFPAELALLKTLLAQCVTTNDGTLVGDMVNTRLTEEEFARRQEWLRKKADEVVAAERERVQREALVRFDRECTSTHGAVMHGCVSIGVPAAAA